MVSLKTKLVSCIVSDLQMSDGHKFRLELAKQIADSGEVDMYGKAFNFIPRKIDAVKDYMFSLLWKTLAMNLTSPRNFMIVF